MDFNRVVHYLADEFKKFERERLEWDIERNELLSKIIVLEGEKKTLMHLNTDMHHKLVLSQGKLDKPSIDVDKKKEDTKKLLYSFMKEAKQLSETPLEDKPVKDIKVRQSYYNVNELEDLATIRVEELKKEKRVWRSSINYRSHFDVVRNVKFIDHFHFLSLSDDGCAKIWNLKSEDPYRCLRTKVPLLSGAILHNTIFGEHKAALCGDLEGNLHLFEINIQKPIEDYPKYDKSFRLFINSDHTDAIWDICTFPNDIFCASVSSDETVKLWQIKTTGLSNIHSLTCILY